MNKTAALLIGTLAVVTVGAPSALAAPKKKPISKTYTASAPMPDPSNYAGQGYSVCAQNVPNSFDKQAFSVPAAGTLAVELNGFQGDWDLLLTDGEGEELAYSGSGDLGAGESVSLRFKKPGKVNIIACNWAGTASASVKYVFTYK